MYVFLYKTDLLWLSWFHTQLIPGLLYVCMYVCMYNLYINVCFDVYNRCMFSMYITDVCFYV